jgi:hypothetical protein
MEKNNMHIELEISELFQAISELESHSFELEKELNELIYPLNTKKEINKVLKEFNILIDCFLELYFMVLSTMSMLYHPVSPSIHIFSCFTSTRLGLCSEKIFVI